MGKTTFVLSQVGLLKCLSKSGNILSKKPCLSHNVSIISEILNQNEYPYEEERRLFYVALTRTRNYIYLLVPKNNPSIFIKELIKDNKKDIEIIHNY